MRRGNGEGSIFKLGGKRRRPWAIRITIGFTPEGKQITKYLSYHATKTEAKAALREYLVDPYDITTAKITLEEIFERWKKESKLSDKTLTNYTSAFNQIRPLHKMNIRDIKVMHIETVTGQLKPSVQQVIKNALNNLYKYAMKHEIVDKNMAELITVERQVFKQRNPFTLKEIGKIKSFKHELIDTVLILLYTGMRISELLEIKTENVHLDKKYMIGGKKTKAGTNRIIPIHDEIFDSIEKRYNEGHKFLITKKGKPIVYRRYLDTFWDRFANTLDIKHTPHDTRHTMISFSNMNGMDQTALKKIVGHSAKDVTDHYTHLDIDYLLLEMNKLKYE